MIKFYNNIEEIYRLSVILKEFCKNHKEIAEISQMSVLVKYISKNIDFIYANMLEENYTC